ncbi:TadE/TadG family type IV pilus assembly protein [Sphingomonas sp. NFR15]|uniref:TadE/TadG family type IV pilus assembly protein n=1 Tax=Sphingomonas sp. NFR15 TaxID=1566282 RepID=UPI0008890661|nr:TadE/TadG family type IV pilus assembly protein [Sphingomonas sp. NFR15]SDA11961.1 Flp pilus assembly protein TadG [Sphingomonas sp. NFR15]
MGRIKAKSNPGRNTARAGLLTRLARDRRGNTLAMMAAFLIPLSALAGSAVDIARLYVVKVRLQQACDAGVLAGRKFMTDSNPSTPLDATSVKQAKAFFANNFPSGWMGTKAFSATSGPFPFTATKTSGSQVAGTAAITVPMTIMKMFAMADSTITVTCQARYDVADTDVMFVLDTTASMACLPGGADSCGTGTYSYKRPATSGGVPGYAGTTAYATNELTSNGSNVSRIDALRKAVLSFYDTFAANADPSTHVRYGFVTYSSSTNVGQAILDKSRSYLVGSLGPSDPASYQSRRPIRDYEISNTGSDTPNNKSQANCTAPGTRTPSAALTYDSSGRATKVNYDVWVTTGGYWNTTSACYTRAKGTFGPVWEYKKLPFDVSALVNGGTSMPDTTEAVPGTKTQWLGCIETPVDNPGQTTFTTTNLPSELNPDLKPSGAARWWPHLQDIEYRRTATPDTRNGDDTDHYSMGSSSLLQSGYVACGKPAKRLGVMARSDVYNYVYATDFVPQGGTYHDVGMIWGSRLISPSGPWADDTTAWPGRPAPNRVIVFMTDGVMAPNSNSYSMYGYEDYDKRVANGDTSNLTNYHNYRFLAACAAAKARNIDVWTVAIASSASTQLQTCATTVNQALYTTTGDGLSAAFTSIAQHLAMLRISK